MPTIDSTAITLDSTLYTLDGAGGEVAVPILPYDPTGHLLLSADAAALGNAALAAETALAVALLGNGVTTLGETDFAEGTAEYDKAVLAVVLQINYQRAAGVEAELVKSWKRGGRSMEYRDNGTTVVSPRAQAIVSALLPFDEVAGAWAIAGGLR